MKSKTTQSTSPDHSDMPTFQKLNETTPPAGGSKRSYRGKSLAFLEKSGSTMPLLLEEEIQEKIKRHLTKRGYHVTKIKLCTRNGFPDLLVIEPRGIASFVEVKRPGETTDPLQDVRHGELRDYGCTVSVADCIEDIDHLYPEL